MDLKKYLPFLSSIFPALEIQHSRGLRSFRDSTAIEFVHKDANYPFRLCVDLLEIDEHQAPSFRPYVW